VVAGFEPLDILQAIYMIIKQLGEGRAEVENQYTRAVNWQGNPRALQAVNAVMELRAFFEWRGLGSISYSALKVRQSLADYDAERRFALPGVTVADPKACQCGEVLKGVLKPWNAKFSAPPALPRPQSAVVWYLPKVPAPHTITMAASPASLYRNQ
jgi:hydrogenase expression/formation protein HypD